MPKVTKIPPRLNPATFAPLESVEKRKVAGYARVSTDSEEQKTSYTAQVDYYTKFIKERIDWEFVGVYTDEGISATNTRHREGFNRMIADALNGKIDLIVTKSVSRFARNTVDSLTTIRKLKKALKYFSKKRIFTRWTPKENYCLLLCQVYLRKKAGLFQKMLPGVNESVWLTAKYLFLIRIFLAIEKEKTVFLKLFLKKLKLCDISTVLLWKEKHQTILQNV